jgi:hypothetical protein
MTTVSQLNDEPPLVEYGNMLSNPFEKKRVYKSLGYMTNDGGLIDGGGRIQDSDLLKGIGPIFKVLEEDNIKCVDCKRSFFDTTSYEEHMTKMHSSYTIQNLVK